MADNLHNDFVPCCNNATGDDSNKAILEEPVKKAPSNAFMIIGGLLILGFIIYPSFLK